MSRPGLSRKDECVYLHASQDGSLAKTGVGRCVIFSNHQNPHAAHGDQSPAMDYFNRIEADQRMKAPA